MEKIKEIISQLQEEQKVYFNQMIEKNYSHTIKASEFVFEHDFNEGYKKALEDISYRINQLNLLD